MLWQAGAWREELIQLPWALPVPLPVHGHYSRAVIEAAYCFAEACGYGVLTTAAAPSGKRTIHQEARPFVCLGFAHYESYEGERILFVHQWRSGFDKFNRSYASNQSGIAVK